MLTLEVSDLMLSRVIDTVKDSGLRQVEAMRVLSIVVPTNRERHSLGLEELFSPVADPLEKDRRIATGGWMVNAKDRWATLQVNCSTPLQLRLRISLLDPDWRRYLIQLYEGYSAGLTTEIRLYRSGDDMMRASNAREGADETLANALGVEVRDTNLNVLVRVRDLESAGVASGAYWLEEERQEEAVAHVRRTFPLLVDIDPDRGGAAGVTNFGNPVVLVDLGYRDYAWAEGAINVLTSAGLHRISDLEKPWGLCVGWGFVLFPQHLSIFAPRDGIDGRRGELMRNEIASKYFLSGKADSIDVSDSARDHIIRFLANPDHSVNSARTLYSGVFGSDPEMREACQRGMMSLIVGDFGLLGKLDDSEDSADVILEAMRGATALQQVAAGTIVGYVDEGEAREAMVRRKVVLRARGSRR